MLSGGERRQSTGEGCSLELNLVYNPQGASLPPSQDELEVSYKQKLLDEYDISFNKLLTITNMPISRFGSMLLSKGEFEGYIQLLKSSYSSCNLQTVMCRNLISIDWQGFVYDCDFNQMLDMPLSDGKKPKLHLDELKEMSLEGLAIKTGEHCYGCTAGQGSSCSGALSE
jgi:radical SAM/Cys-rich protein